MTEKPKVAILLAAYNGERYLKRQLDSLLQQTYENMTIYIRDDGSTDGTVGLIREYQRKHLEREIVLIENGGKNLRSSGNFYQLLKSCTPADFYAFCDQDDEWYPQKVEWAVQALQKETQDQVLLYYTACDYRTEDGTFLRQSPRQKEELALSDVLYYTPGSGFTMVINEKARQELVLQIKPGPEFHDRWLIRGSVCLGKVIYDPRSSAAHIRHPDAVTAGDAGNGSLLTHFLKEELFGEQPKKEKQALVYFAQVFSKQLSKEQKQLLHIFTEKNTPVRWLKKVFYPKRLRTRVVGEVALRLLFLFGRI
ncbi:MAG: glycosyltransferase [Lachnospiraceae bacterium]